ncbi:hypothetical protein PAL_GLEAN10002685 [Pteropus alecto]|uniref:Uncharacterized protein n=1 Tax=Pteropus alecto TaxID=9402 RepID=L5KC17_PTEAL|nr:hypothetical protein PAL_GLEAN10002685 [Pteropus alecto]
MRTSPVIAKKDDNDNCDDYSNSQQHCSPSKGAGLSALRKHQAYRSSRDGQGTELLGGEARMEHRRPVLGPARASKPSAATSGTA